MHTIQKQISSSCKKRRAFVVSKRIPIHIIHTKIVEKCPLPRQSVGKFQFFVKEIFVRRNWIEISKNNTENS